MDLMGSVRRWSTEAAGARAVRPSGLCSGDARRASSLVQATPQDSVMPSLARTASRSRAAICTAGTSCATALGKHLG